MTEKIIKAPEGRPERKPIARAGRLDVRDKKPGRHYRFLNATSDPGRVDYFKDLGYKVAIDGESVNGKTFQGAQSEINLKGGDKGVLMWIPQEYYDEDQALKQRSIDEQERLINEEAAESMAGFRSKGGLTKG